MDVNSDQRCASMLTEQSYSIHALKAQAPISKSRVACERSPYRTRHPISAETRMGKSNQPRGWQVSHCSIISGKIHHLCLCQVQIRLPTLALKPRGNIIRSPKQRYYWPHKKNLCPPKIKKKTLVSMLSKLRP